MKAIFDKMIENIILNGSILKAFPSKIRNETKVSTLAPFVQYSA